MLMLDRLLLAAVLGTACSAGTISTRQSYSNVDSCPGYTASNIVDSGTSLTADLSLAGAPCNAYGDDLTDLKLSVEYQTGEWTLLVSVISLFPHTFPNLVSNFKPRWEEGRGRSGISIAASMIG